MSDIVKFTLRLETVPIRGLNAGFRIGYVMWNRAAAAIAPQAIVVIGLARQALCHRSRTPKMLTPLQRLPIPHVLGETFPPHTRTE